MIIWSSLYSFCLYCTKQYITLIIVINNSVYWHIRSIPRLNSHGSLLLYYLWKHVKGAFHKNQTDSVENRISWAQSSHGRHSFLQLSFSSFPPFCRSGFHSLLKVTQIDLAGWQGVTLEQPHILPLWLLRTNETDHAGFRTNTSIRTAAVPSCKWCTNHYIWYHQTTFEIFKILQRTWRKMT